MDQPTPSPLLRSFERRLRALNRSGDTIQSYLDGARQAEAFLAGRGRTLTDPAGPTSKPSSPTCSPAAR
jgi:hypothetical protein